MAQLQLLLDQRNCWQQSIKLELFQGSKDIFRDSVPVHASRKQEFLVEQDAVTPVPLYSSLPNMKYTRIITAEEISPGKFNFMCSCGFDFRYQGTCRHISLLLLYASDNKCAGCDIENIALRNTAAYAACRDAKLIQVALWTGVRCGHVTEDSLRHCPCPCDEHGSEGDDHREGGDDQYEDQRETSARTQKKGNASSEWIQRRDAKLAEIQDHFYRLKAKLASSSALCKDQKDKEDFFERAEKVDSHILAAFQELSDVPDVPQSTVALRYRDDAKRRRPKTPPPNKRRTIARGESAPKVSATPASCHAIIHVSDSEELEEILNGGASSDD
jgi:hypothetical protein